MANFKQDTPQPDASRFSQPGASPCAQCEAALADVLDGTLTAEEQAQFDLHLATCEACAHMLADAQRGAAWLEMLRSPRPEPSATLLERILAQTSGQTSGQAANQIQAARHSAISLIEDDGAIQAPPRMATVLPFRSRVTAAFHRNAIGHAMLQPRLAMTAAMAFFSIGLTLNLTGVRLNELRLANLKPANVRRSFYQADAHLVRYYTNLRVVYELESRVRDLQHASGDNDSGTGDNESKPADVPKNTPEQKKANPLPGAGTSQGLGNSRDSRTLATLRLTPFASSLHQSAQEGETI